MIPRADTELVWRFPVDSSASGQWAMRRCKLVKAIELWVREDEDLPGVCVILPFASARFLARVLLTS
jgi:hypothetical protein